MQNEILEKLKVKKTPKAQEAVLVNIPRKKINVRSWLWRWFYNNT